MKFYPYKKGGGAEKVLAVLKGGHKQFWRNIYVAVLAILKQGRKKFPLFKRGVHKVLPCLDGGGGGTTSFGPATFPFCSPTSPYLMKSP